MVERLGICWVILEERWPEFREQVRDPYPAIAEKAVGRWGRYSRTSLKGQSHDKVCEIMFWFCSELGFTNPFFKF
jgi:hypothetical protein